MLLWQDVDKSLANAVLKKLKHHTWYLNQEYIPLSLFSDLISDRQKSQIATRLLEIQPKQSENYQYGHPTEVDLPTNRREGLSLELLDFIGNGSNFLFDVLNFDRSWLNLHVSEWKNSESYRCMEDFVHHLKTTNEAAERGVKMISDFANSLTKNETERQALLQVVQCHRRYHPGQKKSSFKSEQPNPFDL